MNVQDLEGARLDVLRQALESVGATMMPMNRTERVRLLASLAILFNVETGVTESLRRSR